MKKEINIVKVKEVACFPCAVYANAVNIASALAQAGRLVNIVASGTGYSVHVYERI